MAPIPTQPIDWNPQIGMEIIIPDVAIRIILLVVVGAVLGPWILTVVGFSRVGVIAGSRAALIQSSMGNVAAGSVFANAQSVAAIGVVPGLVGAAVGGVLALASFGVLPAGSIYAWFESNWPVVAAWFESNWPVVAAWFESNWSVVAEAVREGFAWVAEMASRLAAVVAQYWKDIFGSVGKAAASPEVAAGMEKEAEVASLAVQHGRAIALSVVKAATRAAVVEKAATGISGAVGAAAAWFEL